MPSITVKNIPPELYERLKQAAKAHHRSINGEIIAIIESAVFPRRIDPEQFLAEARKLRQAFGDYVITDEEFNQAKREGRL
jgi:plasmid stability protein